MGGVLVRILYTAAIGGKEIRNTFTELHGYNKTGV